MNPAAYLSVVVTANTNPAMRGLLRFNTQLTATEGKANKALGAVKTLAKGAAIGAAGGLAYAVKKAADFEQQLDSLGAVTDATGKQLDQLRQQAMKAGADTKYSALQAAQAQTELAKGGLTVQQIMKGGLKSALALAAAGELDLADAAATTSNAMNLFGLRGKAAMKVADQLATAANTTTADVSDFALALQQGGSVAKTAGLNLSETVLALEALAKSGIKGSDAGTSLKTSLVQLLAPSKQQKALADQLNISFVNQAGRLKNMSQISDMLRDRLGGMTKAQRLATLATLAGTDGVRTLTALYDAGSGRLDKWRDGLKKQGTAADVAAKKQDNLKGKLENLQGSVETIAIAIGSKLIPGLSDYADQLTKILNSDLSGGDKFAKISSLLATAIGRGISKAGAAAIKAAPSVAGGFVKAFMSADVWGKLAIGGAGGFILTKLGLTKGIAGLILGRGGRGNLGGGGGLAGLLNKPVPVVVTNPGFGGKPGLPVPMGAGSKVPKIPPVLAKGGGVPQVIAAIKITSDFFKDKSDLGLLDQFADDIERVAKTGDGPGMRALADKMREVANANRDQTKGDHLRAFATQLENMAARGGKGLDGLLSLFRKLPKTTGSALPQVASHLAKTSQAADKLGDKTKQTSDRVKAARGPMDNLKAAASRLAGQAGVATGKVDRLGNEVRDLPSRKKVQVLVDIGLQGIDAAKGFFGGGGGDGWGIEKGVDKAVAARVQQAARNNPASVLGNLTGGGSANLMGANPILAPFAALGSKFGLSVVSGLRPGAITNAGNVSYHASGHAIDVDRGSAGQMLAYAKAMAGLFGSRLKELIHTPLGFSIKNGRRVAPYAVADHYDHVHVAMQRGGLLPGTRQGDRNLALLEDGEFVVNREATRRTRPLLEALNSGIPRFQKGGRVPDKGKADPPYSPIETAALAARKAGFRGADLINMLAIAGRESSYNPRAHNYNLSTGDDSYGLWQINVLPAANPQYAGLAHSGRLFNPYTNASIAHQMFSKSGYGPWRGVNYGNAASFLDDARAAVASTAGARAKPVKKHRALFGNLSKILPTLLGPTGKDLGRQISELTKAAEIAGDMASRAESIGGTVNGKDQIGWLNDQLGLLFRLRNKLIDAEKLIETRRDAYTEAIEKAHKRLRNIGRAISQAAARRRATARALATEQKRPRPNKKRVADLKKMLDSIDRAQAGRVAERKNLTQQIPGFEKSRKTLNTRRGDLLTTLADVQGPGSTLERLTTLPKLGVLGGQILEVQLALRDAANQVTDNSPVTDTSTVDMLKQLLREANLRTSVSEAQFKTLRDFDLNTAPFLGAFARGGLALVGERGPELAHMPSGTRIHSASDTQALMKPDVHVVINGDIINVPRGRDPVEVVVGDRRFEKAVNAITRNQARKAHRGLSSRGGGNT